jgi:ubiquinone biosynthesis O-methyltransferase
MTRHSDLKTVRPAESTIVEFFDEMATTRNAVFRSNPIIEYEQQMRSNAVLAGAAPLGGSTVLDIGCGDARDIVPMLEAGATVVGVDLSEGMIRQARLELESRGHHNVTLEIGDVTALQFGAGTFDTVICSEVIEHVPDAAGALREIYRVLKSGGRIVLSTPNRRSWYGFDRYVMWQGLLRRLWKHPFDQWRSKEEMCALLENAGFTIRYVATTCYVPGFLITYAMPRPMQNVLVRFLEVAKPLVSRIAKGYGYTLVVTGGKQP